MYRKILLTTDGSDLAAAAIPHAVTLANATGAEVVVLQVVDSVAHLMSRMTPATIDPLPAGAVTAELAEESVAGQRSAAEQHLRGIKSELQGAGVERVSLQIAEGNPGEAIVDAAAELGCDLIVMATHGRSGLGRVILGSVADHVVRNSMGAAVLLVRPRHKDDD